MKLLNQSLVFTLALIVNLINIVFAERIESTCGRRYIHHTPLIVNGFPTNEGDWPWHAAIYHFNVDSFKYKCGGTVLNPNSILSAAHCVFENSRPIIPERVSVHLGKHDEKHFGTHTQEFQVHKLIPHINFSTSDLSNDIAIIRLSTEVTFNNYIQPICLWDPNKTSISEVINKFGTAIGWGVTESNELSQFLRQASMPVVSKITCLDSNRQVFGQFLSENNFCAGYRNGTSICNGDSGGSFAIEENGLYRIRGIVSLAASQNTGLCLSSEYVLFTDVAKYLSWIKELVPQLPTFPSESGNVTPRITNRNGNTLGNTTLSNQRELNFIYTQNVRWKYSCDFVGGDISSQKSRYDLCGGICSVNKRCTHFTWTKDMCLMKHFDADATATVLRNNHDIICGWIHRPPAGIHFQIDGNSRWSFNCEYKGGDISSRKSIPTNCIAFCENKEDCTHFSFTSYNGGTCWLKGAGVNTSAYFIDDENASCGWISRDTEWNISGKVRWNTNCDFVGGDISFEKSTSEECKKLCLKLDDCYYFTWTPFNGGTCYLKGKQVNRHTEKSDENGICGWIKRNE